MLESPSAHHRKYWIQTLTQMQNNSKQTKQRSPGDAKLSPAVEVGEAKGGRTPRGPVFYPRALGRAMRSGWEVYSKKMRGYVAL
jgi:hypothetical protein